MVNVITRKVEISEAINSLNPEAKTVVRGDDIDDCIIEWIQGTPEISKADIKTKMSELQTEYDSMVYARNRAKEYGTVEKQIEFITEKGLEAWKTNVQAIKTKYPKE